MELSDVIYNLETALHSCKEWAEKNPNDFLAAWAENTADAIKKQLDKVQA